MSPKVRSRNFSPSTISFAEFRFDENSTRIEILFFDSLDWQKEFSFVMIKSQLEKVNSKCGYASRSSITPSSNDSAKWVETELQTIRLRQEP